MNVDENEDIDTTVDVEADDPDLLIRRPFDPEKIKVRTVPLVVEQLVSRIKHEEIDLAPDFQRLRGVWDRKRKARLIESLLLRIPLPVFYVAADKRENWSVVDGLQRMSTIDEFVSDGFELDQLEYLTQLDEHKFSDLPRPMQRRVSETQLLVHVIEPGTPEEVMFNIFSRINTGGLRLNGQEIRHALHKGPIRAFLKDLADSPEFLTATANSVKKTRMADRECVLRFLAFHIDEWEGYNSNDLDGYLGTAMDKINRMSPEERLASANDFKKAMGSASVIFDDDAFRKRYVAGAPRNPISKSLFEAWSVQLARSTSEQIAQLISRRQEVRAAFIELMKTDRAFEVSISYSTGVPQRVLKRFGAIRDLVEGFVR
jgi:hypothetical protein